jgi:hypothetical protein
MAAAVAATERPRPTVALDAAGALAFVREHGVVLASARGPAPRLIEAILGEPIAGNWWMHPKARGIFSVLMAVHDSPDVLTCRLVGKHLTLVHRRLWPALARLASRIGEDRLEWVREAHEADGRHRHHNLPFPGWVPQEIGAAAKRLTEDEALALLPSAVARIAR